ncbi:hypothetical protein RVR_1543 [Actinacidiphila reveromycinica]|uniref:Uncharacterized protein n=1 Tax=Actinacidiphila reveromycinica TaxID=659352 RepID=A0A7U3VM76_9ACTN|nr:hypothetical protein RVR_1543 [Streptomyces sp. SN-593]
MRYIVDPDSRVGYGLLWCGACLCGITVSRVRAPDGAPTRALSDPEASAGVPDFVRVD